MVFAKYSPRIAARKIVSKNVRLGVSRHLVKHRKEQMVTSVGTARNHEDALSVFAKWLLSTKGKTLKNFDETDIAEFMAMRAFTTSQSCCDLARQAINMHLLFEKQIPYVASIIEKRLVRRSYHPKQLEYLIETADDDLKLSIMLCEAAGLRCVELISIFVLDENLNGGFHEGSKNYLIESDRQWNPNRFVGREAERRFIVVGKGGLIREVRLPQKCVELLMGKRRPCIASVADRKCLYDSQFDLLGGNEFSKKFGTHSKRVLGFSNGAHGLRHTFAKRRIYELLCLGVTFDEAVLILSNELGHFASKNTFLYLRD